MYSYVVPEKAVITTITFFATPFIWAKTRRRYSLLGTRRTDGRNIRNWPITYFISLTLTISANFLAPHAVAKPQFLLYTLPNGEWSFYQVFIQITLTAQNLRLVETLSLVFTKENTAVIEVSFFRPPENFTVLYVNKY